MRIAHTADVHIRGLSRHSEFRDVFAAFANDVKEQRVDHIAIEGDLFHTKTQGITPEYIDFMVWWLKALADAIPYAGSPIVHIRLGNHDQNLSNASRQDAISPIISAMNDPRIKLYKKSGTYAFAPGFNWCVFGIADQEGWSSVQPVPGEVNIACYHGAVAGAKTESDWEIEGEVDVGFFERFDFAFLGDIHKFQHLGRRENGQPWISYPGTAVQQNYAEALDHSYILWEIESRDVFKQHVRPLPNPKPFVTVDWTRSALETIATLPGLLPSGARVRIRSDDKIAPTESTSFVSWLRNCVGPTEITFKHDHASRTNTIAAGGTVIAKADLRNQDVLARLIREHHAGSIISDDARQDLERAVGAYLRELGTSESVTRNVKWSLRNLAFDNTFSFGTGNVINFDGMGGIAGIFGPNRSGKSSIVGTIMYALFNTTDRGPVKNMHVVNSRRDHCYTRFLIGVDDVDYVIERQTAKHENKRGIASGATSLNLFRVERTGDLTDLCGEQRTDTEKVIRSLIGSPDDFLLTSLSAQGNVNRFIDEGSTQRRLIMAKFFDLEVFEKMHERAKDDAKSRRDTLKRLPDLSEGPTEDVLSARIAEHSARLSAIAEEHSSLDAACDDVRSQLAVHRDFTPVTKQQLDAQEKKVTLARSALSTCDEKCAESMKTHAELVQRIERAEQIKSQHDVTALRARLDDIRALERDVIDLRHAKDRHDGELMRAERSLKILSDVPCGDAFPLCKFIKDAHASKANINELTAAVASTAERLQGSESDLTAALSEKVQERLKKYEQVSELLMKTKLDAEKLKTEIGRCTERRGQLERDLQLELTRLGELQAALSRDENVEVVALKSQLESLKERLRSLDAEKIRVATSHGRTEAELEKRRDLAAQRAALEAQCYTYDLITRAVSKAGIPRTIIATELPIINAEIAEILHGIVDFTVELVAEDDGNALDVYIDYGDMRRMIELGSGMEKFVSSIAIRVALTNVSSLPKTDTFIVDEGFGSLDDTSIEACGRLLQSLKRYFKSVIVISHVDGIKDAVDDVIEITRTGLDSRVVH